MQHRNTTKTSDYLAFFLTFSATEISNSSRNLQLHNTAVPKSWLPSEFFCMLQTPIIVHPRHPGSPKVNKKPRFMGES